MKQGGADPWPAPPIPFSALDIPPAHYPPAAIRK
jgi:hypothetical protein